MTKKVLAVLLILSMLIFNGVGYAADNDTESVYSIEMTYITNATCNLVISGSGLASMSANISAVSGVDSVRISMYLQRYNSGWSTISSWSQEYSGNSGSMSKTQYVTSGYDYRILVYFFAYDGGTSESVSRTSYDSY